MISKTTVLKALKRFVIAFISGGLASFALITPPNFQNLKDIEVWFSMAAFAFVTGAVMGVQKAITGYFNYDKK